MSLAGFIVIRCAFLSGKRLLVFDELLTWYPVSAPFHSMLLSTTDTINASPPLYFIGAWFWAALFGGSAISLRLFSVLAVAIALLLMFGLLKRVYGALAASAAVAVAFIDPEVLNQSAEARFYGLMLAEVALGIFIYQRMMALRRPPIGLLAANTVLHACLIMTHYYGFVYSGVILAGAVLTCVVSHRNPLRIGLSIVAGWLVFLPWIPIFLRHLKMGRPSFWIPVPDAADLRDYYGHFLTGDASKLAALLVPLVALAAVLAAANRSKHGEKASLQLAVRTKEKPLLLLALMFGLVPLAIYFISTRPGGISGFRENYLMPTSLGWAIICAHVSNRVFRLGPQMGFRRTAKAVSVAQLISLAALIGWFDWTLLEDARAARGQHFLEFLPASFSRAEPVVIEHVHEFMVMHFYSAEPRQFLFLVDPDAGIKAGGGAPANHQVMAALKRQFPNAFTEVRTSDDFLSSTKGFWVRVSTMHWLEIRIRNNPAFTPDALIPSLDLVHVRRSH